MITINNPYIDFDDSGINNKRKEFSNTSLWYIPDYFYINTTK